MCQLMGVSRSAYYDYVRRADNCSVDPRHEEILEKVLSIANSAIIAMAAAESKKR